MRVDAFKELFFKPMVERQNADGSASTLTSSETTSLASICRLPYLLGGYLWADSSDEAAPADAEATLLQRTARWLSGEGDRSPGSLVRQRSYLTTLATNSELRTLHAARKTAFDPDATVAHRQLLRSIWSALRTDEFVRSGEGWKEVGFQGSDPATDVRAGGALAVQAIAHFATLQTHGFRLMLSQVSAAAAANPDHYYPTCCTAVVCCAALCDALGISNGMRGAVPDAELNMLLASPPTSPLAPFCFASWSSWALGRRGGFLGLFALLFAEFHARWHKYTVGYMQTQQLLTECVARLERRALAVSRSGGFTELRDACCADDDVGAEVAALLGEREASMAKMKAAGDAVRMLHRINGRGSVRKAPDEATTTPPSCGGGGGGEGTTVTSTT